MALNSRDISVDSESPHLYDSDRTPSPFVDELRELFRYRDLVRLWSIRNVTLRYKRSVLGVLWTLIEPLMLMVILATVFSALFRASVENYAVYILTGLLVFDFFSRSTQQIVDEIIASHGLAQRIHLPRSALAVASIFSYLINWGLAMIPLFAIMLFLGHPFSWSLLVVPLIFALVALFAVGIGLAVATVGAFFHDFKVTYSILLTAWLYATPIIYPLDIVPEQYKPIFKLNPMLHLVDLFRAPVYLAEFPSLQSWLLATTLALSSASFGWWIFTRSRRVFEYQV